MNQKLIIEAYKSIEYNSFGNKFVDLFFINSIKS